MRMEGSEGGKQREEGGVDFQVDSPLSLSVLCRRGGGAGEECRNLSSVASKSQK